MVLSNKGPQVIEDMRQEIRETNGHVWIGSQSSYLAFIPLFPFKFFILSVVKYPLEIQNP